MILYLQILGLVLATVIVLACAGLVVLAFCEVVSKDSKETETTDSDDPEEGFPTNSRE